MNNIKNPSHYGGADNPCEAIKVIEAHELNFHIGNAVKYLLRAGKKPNTQKTEDLNKAVWYILREIANSGKALDDTAAEWTDPGNNI